MNNFEILKKLRVELKAGIDRKIKKDNQRFFKEKILCYGVRTPLVRRLSKKYFQEILRGTLEK
ncbi:MAG: hypothetical protein UW63_C0089G0007 [Candidatus Uhrbacteria bacterium GW2011_GWF2_44_350]|uniref:Trigger factor n=1 Tax=Candidatus Uhrbacteria bacterium GW2011_GWF2_44_350 TaxID=1619000 RepID=A0A0G1J8R8_9BACT|nr:MAG: hypothetical protein UW63_C0089G0007 [Candidatus Uhrbacteria bacterium GW2011_GWF2_44_350]